MNLAVFVYHVLLPPGQFWRFPRFFFHNIKYIMACMINIEMTNIETNFSTLTPENIWSNFNPCSPYKKLTIYTLYWLNFQWPVINIIVMALPQVTIKDKHYIIELRKFYFSWILIHFHPHCASCSSLQSLIIFLLDIPSIIMFTRQCFWCIFIGHPSTYFCAW